MFIVHEVMGRDCGWLTAATAASYTERIEGHPLLPELFVDEKRLGVHAVYLPEMAIDLEAEGERLKRVMDEHDCVNIFISEGAGVRDVVKELEANGVEVQRDAFGHIKLDSVNVGKYFAEQFARRIGAPPARQRPRPAAALLARRPPLTGAPLPRPPRRPP